MTSTLREIGDFIDPVDDPISMVHASAHHRWQPDPAVVSLSAMAARHDHPDSVRLRFLWYNTFLMRVRVNLAAALAEGATPTEVMKALKVNAKDFLGTYNVCNLLPTGVEIPGLGSTPGPRELCKLADNAVDYVIDYLGGTEQVVDLVIEKLGAKKSIEIMLQLAGIPGEVVLDTKPALQARAREIGEVLNSESYDVAALCETWNSDLRSELLAHWQLPDTSQHLALGREEGAAFMGDGLLLGSLGGRVLEMKRYGFEKRGINRDPGLLLDMLADDELWARKGSLLVRLDAGVGVIDLYLTHLYFGTGLIGASVGNYFPPVAPPDNDEREDVRSSQLDELGAFIEKTHDPSNVAIVCGDFNIDANEHDPAYKGLGVLEQFATKLDLQDRWSHPHNPAPFWGATGGDFSKICATTQANDARFCVDGTANSGGYRIDFVFVEAPKPQHAFMLDVTRVRRRPFPRANVTDGQAFLSDHMGLDCSLLASPL